MTRTFHAAAGVALAAALATAAATARGIQGPTVSTVAFVNGRVISGEGPRAFEDVPATILISEGKVVSVGPRDEVRFPAYARIINLAGKFVMPGLISAHAHVSDVQGLKPRAYTEDNTRRQLEVFARYGVTSVFSLGGEQAPAFALRDAQNTAGLTRARIFLAGAIVTGRTPAEAREAVARVAATKPDIIKIRVDDNLGTATKMTPDVYQAVVDEAHQRGIRVAAHIFYLEDAKGLLKAGVDMIAHSVRDRELDAETLALLKARHVPYCPTLTREYSAFAYEAIPDFFRDAFFLKDADPDVVAQLREPARQAAMRASASAQRYKAALATAMANLKIAADAGVTIVMGTDSGAFPERFQGYFEHLEMWFMAEGGIMKPAAILRAATVDAAKAIGRGDIGAIAVGKWADLVVLTDNPLTRREASRTIDQVWVAGNLVKR